MNTNKILSIFIATALCASLVKFLPYCSAKKTHHSACAINVDAATLAVESAYSPCDPVCTGYTPLMLAAMRGNREIAERLIAHGVPLDTLSQDINPRTESSNNFALHNNTEAKPYGNTALHIAIYNTNFPANYPVAQLLINSGANVRIHNSSGDTPMHYIMQRVYRVPALDNTNLSEREDLMINLISHGADINAQNNQGYSMLHVAVFDGEGEWIRRLLNNYGSLVDFHAKSFETSCDSLTKVENMPGLKREPCIRLTPLQLAGQNAGNNLGGTYARSILLGDVSSNPNVLEGNIKPIILGANDRDIMGMTGFMLAVIWEGTQKLKNPHYDASKNIPDPQNPSQSFPDPHRDFTVDNLMQQADLNAVVLLPANRINYGLENTVLHIALLHQLPDMIIKIIDGAKKMFEQSKQQNKNLNVNKQNILGDAPLHYVIKLNALKIPAASKPGNLNQYNNESRNKIVDALIRAGGNINIQNNDGNTLLHLAVKAHLTDLVNFLLKAYNVKDLKENQLINLSLRNKDGVMQGAPGKTALDLAQDLNFADIASAIQAAIPENQKLLVQPKNPTLPA